MTTEQTGTGARAAIRTGWSVRTRITALVAVLVVVALSGAGLIVYLIEERRIANATEREVEQELDEFVSLKNALERNDATLSTEALLREFLLRNVPDDDELLVAWVGDGPIAQFPADPLVEDEAFRRAVAPLVTEGGTAYLDTAQGEVRVRSQPVREDGTAGALLVVSYLEEDRDELLSTMRTYAVTAGLSALLITAAASWWAGRLLRPLRSLRVTAEEISATDLSRRIPEDERPGRPGRRDDITALTHTVNGMLERLEAAFVAQRRFLDDAGHELRTPLTVLRGHLELLDTADADEVEQTRALLVDEVDRMARLVGDLILLAKSGRPDFLSPAPTDIGDLVGTVVAKARGLGERSWTLDPVRGVLVGRPLVLDEQRITQALLQFADNAVKHTVPGAEIGVGAELDGSTLRLWVRDQGPGVAAEDRERIFERFGRGAVPAGDEGFGLGLSIVSAIAAAHGGRAYVTDVPTALGGGTGACFVLEMPAVRTDPHQEP